jgi:Helix-turn-helix domain
VPEPALSFAGLLRQFRTEARLTQEELAEAAGLSPRSVSDLERGVNRASCAPAVTGIRPRLSARPLSSRPARPGTGPPRPACSTSSVSCSS